MLGNMDSERRLQIPSLDRVRAALGGRLPSIIENTTFTPDGLAESEKGLLVPVYLANGLGFNEAGRYFIDNEIKPRMEVAGALVFDPFQQCAEFIQPDFLIHNKAYGHKWTNGDVLIKLSLELLITSF